jgi:hypothetical protein
LTEEKAISLAHRKLMVAIPAYDGKLNIQAAFALAQVAVDSNKYGYTLQLAHMSGSSIITRARNYLVKYFLDSDATDMLFVDADVRFKAEDVVRILAMSDGKDVVCGAYPRRGGKTSFFLDIDYGPNDEVYFDDGLLRIKRIGTGFMLIRKHVLVKLIDAHPEWAYHVDTDNSTHYSVFDFKSTPQGYMGEDYLFCDRVREHGMSVHLDPEINLGHFGTNEWTANFKDEVLSILLKKD